MKHRKQVREVRITSRPTDDRDSPDREILTPEGCRQLLLIGEKSLAKAMRDGLPYVSISNTYRFVRPQVLEWVTKRAAETAARSK